MEMAGGELTRGLEPMSADAQEFGGTSPHLTGLLEPQSDDGGWGKEEKYGKS